ncbi:MAG: hypothetical protein ACREQ9_10680 [Candidatus Binatia bacterium]
MKTLGLLSRFGIPLLLGVLVLTGAGTAIAGGPPQKCSADLSWHGQSGNSGEVAGSEAHLMTKMDGAWFMLHTSELKPGHAYTVWWVIINEPSACASSPCASSDVLFNTGAVEAEVGYAAGHVVGESGDASFSAYLPTGDVPGGWFGNAFTNPLGAEIHLVLNDHGPKLPGYMPDMIRTYRGGCTDQSLPPAFPATAKADGRPGPNTCRLYQVAIFQQQSSSCRE